MKAIYCLFWVSRFHITKEAQSTKKLAHCLYLFTGIVSIVWKMNWTEKIKFCVKIKVYFGKKIHSAISIRSWMPNWLCLISPCQKSKKKLQSLLACFLFSSLHNNLIFCFLFASHIVFVSSFLNYYHTTRKLSLAPCTRERYYYQNERSNKFKIYFAVFFALNSFAFRSKLCIGFASWKSVSIEKFFIFHW